MSAVEIWQAIEGWLHHYQPWVLGRLRPGTTAEELEHFESELGTAMPADMRASYQRHDGEGPEVWLFGSQSLLPLDLVLRSWREQAALAAGGAYGDSLPESFPHQIQRVAWSPLWVPFAYDGSGGYLHIDLGPASSGQWGQVIQTTSDGEFRWAAASLEAFLQLYLNHLVKGAFVPRDGQLEARCGYNAWWEHPPRGAA